MDLQEIKRPLKQGQQSDSKIVKMVHRSRTKKKFRVAEQLIPTPREHTSESHRVKYVIQELIRKITSAQSERTRQEDAFIAMIHDLDMLF
jgi:hypothetical protein